MPKTIGVLGGMGSRATLHFFGQLLDLSEPDEFRIIIDNNVEIPSRTLACREGTIAPKIEVQGAIWNAIDRLVWPTKAGFAAVPCNSAHYWYDERRPWLNLISTVSDAVRAQGYSRPLILGGYVTVEKRLYSEYLPDAVYLPQEANEEVYRAIQAIKNNEGVWYDLGFITDLQLERYGAGADCVLLACTELSLVADRINIDKPVVDSSLEYAKAVVEYARGE